MKKKKLLYSKDEVLVDIYPLSPKIFPKEEAKENFKDYFDKLRSAIMLKGISNIAVTGSYGSGKTTILKNYQNIHDTREAGSRYLNISLATFSEESTYKENSSEEGENNPPKESVKKNKNIERLIELSIIQQILYHVEASKIPNSNLKRIRKSYSTHFLLVFMALSIVWIYATILLFKFDHISRINPNNWSFDKPFEVLSFILVILFTSGLGYIIDSSLVYQ